MTTNQYSDHIRQRHQIREIRDQAQRLVPDLDRSARRSAKPTVAAEPVGSLLPLPATVPAAPAPELVWAIAALDGKRRLPLAAARRELGWPCEAEVQVAPGEPGELRVTATPDPAARRGYVGALDARQHRLTLPTWLSVHAQLDAGQQVLLAIDTDAEEVRVLPASRLTPLLTPTEPNTQEVAL